MAVFKMVNSDEQWCTDIMASEELGKSFAVWGYKFIRMPEVNFYLKKLNPATGKSLILLRFQYHKIRLVFSFKETIKPSEWNSKKQRVKTTSALTADGTYLVNDLLDNLQKVCEKTYDKEKSKGIPVPGVLKKALLDFLNYNIVEDDKKNSLPTLFDLIDRFCSGEIKYKGRDKSRGSIQNYAAVRKHLLEFKIKESYPVTFETINLDFFYRYTTFLSKKLKLAHNTIAKDISIIKVFMGEAFDLGYTTNLQFKNKKFSMPEVDVDACYLTEEEILKLYRFDLSDCKRLERVRDLFVFGCWVGLRYSDYSNIKPENIIEEDGDLYIKMVTQKTKAIVIIPLNPIVLEIFKKYDANPNKLPAAMTDVNFNKYIKEVAKKVGFDSVGRVATNPEKKLYELIASHTARRSFATNYYLQGFPTIDLMKITGHRTESSFLKYIRVSKLDTAKRLQKHIKQNLSRYLLSAAG